MNIFFHEATYRGIFLHGGGGGKPKGQSSSLQNVSCCLCVKNSCCILHCSTESDGTFMDGYCDSQFKFRSSMYFPVLIYNVPLPRLC